MLDPAAGQNAAPLFRMQRGASACERFRSLRRFMEKRPCSEKRPGRRRTGEEFGAVELCGGRTEESLGGGSRVGSRRPRGVGVSGLQLTTA